jgi:hypothetical protein
MTSCGRGGARSWPPWRSACAATPGSDHLLRLDDVTGALGWRGERQLGLQTIRLDTIVGTVDSGCDFDRHFRPASGRVRERWEQLALAQRLGAAIPPIEVYRVGGLHFVSDGHHRVSIAAATGQQTIDAYVTEILRSWLTAPCNVVRARLTSTIGQAASASAIAAAACRAHRAALLASATAITVIKRASAPAAGFSRPRSTVSRSVSEGTKAATKAYPDSLRRNGWLDLPEAVRSSPRRCSAMSPPLPVPVTYLRISPIAAAPIAASA